MIESFLLLQDTNNNEMTSYLNIKKTLRKAKGPGSPDRGSILHEKNEVVLARRKDTLSHSSARKTISSNQPICEPYQLPARASALLKELHELGVVGVDKTTPGENEIAACFALVGSNDPSIKSITIEEDPRFSHVSNSALVEFARSVRYNFELQSLTILGCEVGNAFLSELAESMKFNVTLKHIDLRRNAFTSDGLVEFCQAMAENATLLTVDLREQHSPIHSHQEDDAAKALGQNRFLQQFLVDFRSQDMHSRVCKSIDRNKMSGQPTDSVDSKVIGFLKEEVERAKADLSLSRSFDTEEIASNITDSDLPYFSELVRLADKYSVDTTLSSTKDKKDPSPVPVPGNGEKLSVKQLIASKLVLPKTNMTSSGNFLNDEYVDSYLKRDEKTGALIFDYTNQIKLFKQFTKEDPARSTIIDKFVNAIIFHPKSDQINAICMTNSLASDDLLNRLCEKCTSEGKLPNLHQINFETNLLHGPGLVALSKAISNPKIWPYLSVLRLENQKSQIDTKAEMALAQGMCLNRSIVHFSLRVRNLAARDKINKAVQRNIDFLRQARAATQKKSPGHHKRTRNKIENFFDSVLEDNPEIVEVNLVGDQVFLALNDASRKEAAASFASNTHVKSVKLSMLKLDDTFATEFGKALKQNQSITKINLENNAISGDGLLAILDGLKTNEVVEELHIRHQSKPIATSSEEKILESLGDNEHLVKFGVDIRSQRARDDLDRRLRKNQEKRRKRKKNVASSTTTSMIKPSDSESLLTKAEKNDSAVTEIRLSGDKEFNEMPLSRKIRFFESLANNTYIESLILDNSNLDNTITEKLAASIKQNVSLVNLSLNQNAFTSPGLRVICEAACRSASLQRLSILKPRFKLTSEDTIAIIKTMRQGCRLKEMSLEFREIELEQQIKSLLKT